MERRSFIQTILASTGVVILGSNLRCRSENTDPFSILPKGSPPEQLLAVKLAGDMDWHKKNLYSCFQGLINRHQTRVYLLHADNDEFWLHYYKKTFDITYELLPNPEQLIKAFKDEVSGYIVYDSISGHKIENALKNMGLIHIMQ